jgi:hypothetical protein
LRIQSREKMRQGVGGRGRGVKRRIIATGSNFHSGSNLMRDMSEWRGKEWG